MTPPRTHKTRYAAPKISTLDESIEGADEREQPQSRSSQEVNAASLAEIMRNQVKHRREKRRTHITTQHAKQLKDLRDGMESGLKEILDRMIRRHKHRLERLAVMIKRRSEIEARMLAHCKSIEDSFVMAEKALKYALERRVDGFETDKI